MIKSVYMIGSLRNPEIPKIANEIQALGIEAFADWFSPGPAADDFWRDYSRERGLTYKEAIKSYGAKHIFEFDKYHLDRCDAAVMLMPAGKSGHLELGYTIGRGKPGYILFDGEPERYDVMTQFATEIFFDKKELFDELTKVNNPLVKILPGVKVKLIEPPITPGGCVSTQEDWGKKWADWNEETNDNSSITRS